MKIKVLVIEPYQMVRRGLTSIINNSTSMIVCGEAENYEESLDLLLNERPDVCIINNRIHQQNGLDVIQKLTLAGAACKFIYLTSAMKPAELQQALSLHVNSVILKDSHPDELIFAIMMASRNKKYYDFELLASKLIEDQPENEHQLTPKELEVLESLSEGLTNKEIASKLFITEYTVKKHVSQVLSKLNLTDRTKAALFFHQQHGKSFYDTKGQEA